MKFIEENEVLPDNLTVANVFNNCFQSITKHIDLLELPVQSQFGSFDNIYIIKNICY